MPTDLADKCIVRVVRFILPVFLIMALASWGLVACKPATVKVSEQPVPILRERVGSGREARDGDQVRISYRATTKAGKEVMAARNYQFKLGSGTVILGIDEGVGGMRVGGKRTIECQPHKHWGRAGYGDKIPPDTSLIFEIELHAVE